MRQVVSSGSPIRGEAQVPGDKSISHRAVLLGAAAGGTSRVRGFPFSGDCRASIAAARMLGGEVEEEQGGALVVRGVGLSHLGEPPDVINCQGSATTMRLLAGLVAGREMVAVLTGNESLRRRPMGRVVEPLRLMGATVLGRDGDRLPPLVIRGGGLRGVRYTLPVASAQVKSCVLLAGLSASGETAVVEPLQTRDHTERMLAAMGAKVRRQGDAVVLAPAERLRPLDVEVPGDVSSAAFLVAATLLVPGSELRLRGIGVNPTRTGFLDVVRSMGGRIALEDESMAGGEPVASLVVEHSTLVATVVRGGLVPRAIDELPLVAVLGTQAEGITQVRDAQELRVKESDRVAALVGELRRMGARIEEAADGFAVEGPTVLRGARVRSHGDHRLAMALAVAALVADGPVEIEGAECAQDSFPGFFELLNSLRR